EDGAAVEYFQCCPDVGQWEAVLCDQHLVESSGVQADTDVHEIPGLIFLGCDDERIVIGAAGRSEANLALGEPSVNYGVDTGDQLLCHTILAPAQSTGRDSRLDVQPEHGLRKLAEPSERGVASQSVLDVWVSEHGLSVRGVLLLLRGRREGPDF